MSKGSNLGANGLSFAKLIGLSGSIVPPWNLAMAKGMFSAKDRASAWDLIADLLDSGLDDVRAIGLAADMFKHRGKRAAAMVLEDLRESFAEGDFEGRMASVTKGAEALVFSNAGRVTGAVVYRGAARVLRNQKAIRDAVTEATAKPAALMVVLIALLVMMGLKMFPTFEALLPREDWPLMTKRVAGVSDFLISGGIWAAGAAAVFVAALGLSLPLLAAKEGSVRKLRASLDRLPPWSFYRLQTGAAFSFAVVEIGRAGGTLNIATLDKMAGFGSRYSKTHVARIADAMREGKTFEDAFATDAGFPDPELNALMRALSSQPKTLDKFAAYVDRWITDAEKLLKQKSAVINSVLLVAVTGVVGAVLTSIFGIMNAVQAGI